MRRITVGMAALALAFGPASAQTTSTTEQAGAAGTTSVAPANAAEGDWVLAPKDYANTRFSALSQITPQNVKDLKVVWTFSTGVNRGQEAAPIIAEQTMFVVTPYPNILYALDLTKPGAPLKWKYEPKPSSAAKGVACCDVVNRGAAYDQGRVFINTLDNHTVAVDAKTGKELWKVKLGDINEGQTITMAPMVVKGLVLVGNSGGEFGVRGWIQALDEATGTVKWKAYNTGPDSEVLIGPDFKPFYKQDQGKDLGVSSWPPEAWKIGGGTVWGWISYDPELDLIYHGTANPGPWNSDQRPGDNKWTSGVFARNPETGQARWFYQWSPHDVFDYDGINENVLVDLEIDGKMRKVLLRPERNGYLYVMDRVTGEVLSATPFAPITSSTGVDLKTGRLIEVDEKKPVVGKVVRDICPAARAPRTGTPPPGRR